MIRIPSARQSRDSTLSDAARHGAMGVRAREQERQVERRTRRVRQGSAEENETSPRTPRGTRVRDDGDGDGDEDDAAEDGEKVARDGQGAGISTPKAMTTPADGADDDAADGGATKATRLSAQRTRAPSEKALEAMSEEQRQVALAASGALPDVPSVAPTRAQPAAFASLLPSDVRSANVPTTMIDEAERKLRRPQVTASEVFRLLMAHYDIGDISRDSMRELPSYDDKNWYFFAYCPDPGEKIIKREFVVKVHNGVDSSGISRGVLAAQERVMAQLGAHGIECPRIIKSKLAMYTVPGPDGTVNIVSADTPGAQREFCTRVTFLATNQVAHTLRVLTYLPGKLLVDIPLPHSDVFVRQSGVFVGRICSVLNKWPTPQEITLVSQRADLQDCISIRHLEQQGMCWKALESRARLWDLRYFMDVQYFMKDLVVRGVFEDEIRVSMCNTVFNAFKHLVMPVSDKLRTGILHNDLNEQNVIILSDMDALENEFGVIDFGDVVVSWSVNEVAIAMAYCALNKRDPIRDMSVMLSGIQSVFPLTPIEMRILPCLIAARLVTSLIMGMYSYHMQIVGESPRDATKSPIVSAEARQTPVTGNSYVLTTQKSGWTALSRLLATGAESMFKRFITDGFSESPASA